MAAPVARSPATSPTMPISPSIAATTSSLSTTSFPGPEPSPSSASTTLYDRDRSDLHRGYHLFLRARCNLEAGAPPRAGQRCHRQFHPRRQRANAFSLTGHHFRHWSIHATRLAPRPHGRQHLHRHHHRRRHASILRGGTTGSVSGNITDNGILALNHSNSSTFTLSTRLGHRPA